MTHRKKLIEVALPLEAINVASAREKSIRHGHPSTLHLWWSRKPLATARAVIFASLVDDPDSPGALPAFVQACKQLPKGKNVDANGDTPRMRLFDFIERLVTWEATTDEAILSTARELIRIAAEGELPPLLDPFAGGGSIPLEAQRLGLEAHAGDLNPVAVMINKAQIEIPPRFADRPPVNPRDRANLFTPTPAPVRGPGVGGHLWRGAAGLAADVRYYGEWMRERAWERIGHLYPTYVIASPEGAKQSPTSEAEIASGAARPRNDKGETVIAWLWARTVKCPNPACGAQMPLVTSFWLSKKKERQAWVEPIIDRQAKTVRFVVKTGKGKPPDPPKVSRGAKFRCLVCGEVAPDQHLKDEGMAGRMGAQLMAIVTEGRNGRSYYAPVPEHEQIIAQAKPDWRPSGELADDARAIWCKLYGLTDFADLFTPRQLVALTTFSDLVAEARAQIHADAVAAGLPDDGDASGIAQPLRDLPAPSEARQAGGGHGARAYAEAVSVYLGMAVSRLSDIQNALCRWEISKTQVRNLFGRQAIPMVWDYAENNLFANAAGDYMVTLGTMVRVLERSVVVNAKLGGSVSQADATTLRLSNLVVISTDPPYYDNIGYADLSDFFYVWMRQSLRDTYPDIFATMLVPKEPELVATPYRFGGDSGAADEHFETGLMRAFANVRDSLPPGFPLTLYYAFKQSEIVAEEGMASTGWETMLHGLIETGFSIVGTWPMRTELSHRMVGIGTNALASSIVLVCRPRPEDAPITSRRDFVNALRRELPTALREMQSGNIAPVDLAQAAIGPGMAVYSRYSQVLEPNGRRLTVRTALQLINQALDEYLAEQEGHIDEDTRFAVAWFEQYGFNAGEFGVADVLARAKNTSVDGLAHTGLLESGAGKVRLLGWKELDPGWDPLALSSRGAQRRSDPQTAPSGTASPAARSDVTVWEATHHLIERLNTHGEEGAASLLAKLPPDLAAEARQLAYRLYAICERKGWAEHARDYNALVISWSASQEQAREFKEQLQQGRLF